MIVPEPMMEPETAAEERAPAAELTLEEEAPADELSLDQTVDEGEELLLGSGDMLADEENVETVEIGEEAPTPGTRSWLAEQESVPPAPRAGGTLFERMSNIARGAAKAQVEEEEAPARSGRDPLDIPRFLNRQNNQ